MLFSPPYQGKVFGPPLGLLSLASSIREEGFAPVIIDGATTPKFLDVIAREVTDAFAFGVSVLTGPMIRDAIAASHVVRQVRPELPIIYGGWHPTLLSAQTLQEDFVDIVVRHQGEKTLTEILKRQVSGATLDLVAGCWFKRNGKIITNGDRPSSPLSTLAVARLRSGGFRIVCARHGRPEAALRHQHRMPLCVQLLHGHGVLQPPLQSARLSRASSARSWTW